MGQISLQIPVVGQSDSTEDPKVANNFTTLQTLANGNIDGTNLSATLAQSAGVNQGGHTMKGAVNIAASESRTNVAFGTLTTPDQVTGLVLPANGLIRVWYQATWQESVSGAASAAIFLGSNQLIYSPQNTIALSFATIGGSTPAGRNIVLASCPFGLASVNGHYASGVYSGDVTTGQAIAGGALGFVASTGGGSPSNVLPTGGPCDIFAAAGTYTVSVQFLASSGSVTASNRKLWVQVLSFS